METNSNKTIRLPTTKTDVFRSAAAAAATATATDEKQDDTGNKLAKVSAEIFATYVKENPNYLVAHHLDSYNNFINRGIFNIFKENGAIKYVSLSRKNEDKTGQPNQLTLYLGGRDANRIYFGKPVIFDQNHAHYMYPNDARLRNMNYAATIHFDVDVDFEITDPQTGERKTSSITLDKIYLGKFHIMTQSCLCILQGLDRHARFQMGECLNDFGGYFIVDGKERTIVSQETFADNMMYIRANKPDDIYSHSAEIRSKSEDTSKPIRTTAVKMVAPNGTYSNRNIIVLVPNVRKPVPLFILMRALGIISDEAIIKTCLLDLDRTTALIDLFIPSVHDAATIFTQETAIKFIASFTKRGTIAGTMEILSDYLLPHVGELNFTNKAYFIGLMVNKMLKVVVGQAQPTDRDNFQFKRVELAGDLLYALFREYFLIYRKAIYQTIDRAEYYHRGEYEANFMSLIEANVDSIFTHKSVDGKKTLRIVEDGFRRAFKGSWGSQENTKRQGVVQVLDRLSWNTFMSHLHKVNLPLDSSAKVVGPRLLNPSQWGFIDPIDTPDGANIGLHKHISLGCRITSGFSAGPFIRWLRENTAIRWLVECTPEYIARLTKVIVNGNWVGVIDDTLAVEGHLKLLRRNGLLPCFMSISFNFTQNELNIYTDSGRLIRPVYYIEKKKASYKRARGDLTWEGIVAGVGKKPEGFSPDNNAIYPVPDDVNQDTLMRNAALIDYVDTAEEDGALIAMTDETLRAATLTADFYTHVEMDPALFLGVMGNQIIFPENNPLTRNAFSCGQSKQAVSVYHSNYAMRMDKMGVVLNYGQVPLIKSQMLQYLNHEEQPYGVNVIVAIMCYTGYNVEDAILVNEGALDRGLFRTTYFTTYETHEESSKVSGAGGANSKFGNVEKNAVTGVQVGYDYSQLDDNGMIMEGTPVTDKTVLIGKLVSNPENRDLWIDASTTPKKGQQGFVDRAFMTEGEEGFKVAKVRVYDQRVPAIGDKFASRSGQKGTIGLVVPECDMPFTSDGVRPHIIINPHAIPSRMTVGQIIESVLGKLCAYNGAYGDCTAFKSRGINYYTYAPHMIRAGYSYTGNEVLYNGMTGATIKSDIYIGPTYYMRLKHMVKDKINYRALGPRTQLTRQTVEGRANDGGLRIGEMERDGVLAHGMSAFLSDSFLARGDEYYLAVCNVTGMIAIYNEARNLFLSPLADGPIQFVTSNAVAASATETGTGMGAGSLVVKNMSRFGRSFSIVRVPFAFKLLIQELQAMNVQMRIITDANVGQLMNMSYSYNVDALMDTLPKHAINMGNPGLSTPDEVTAQIGRTVRAVQEAITAGMRVDEVLTTAPLTALAASAGFDVGDAEVGEADTIKDTVPPLELELKLKEPRLIGQPSLVPPAPANDETLSNTLSPMIEKQGATTPTITIKEQATLETPPVLPTPESEVDELEAVLSKPVIKKVQFGDDVRDVEINRTPLGFKTIREETVRPSRPTIPDVLAFESPTLSASTASNEESSKKEEEDRKTIDLIGG